MLTAMTSKKILSSYTHMLKVRNKSHPVFLLLPTKMDSCKVKALKRLKRPISISL